LELHPVLAVMGPTASGKTQLAVGLCRELGGEMVNADSRQAIAELEVGVCKPTVAELQGVVCHGLDWAHLGEPFSAARYRQLAARTVDDLLDLGRTPVVVGGTGLYVRALLDGFDFGRVPPAHERATLPRLDQEKRRLTGEALAELIRLDPDRAAAIDTSNPRRLSRAVELARAGTKAARGGPRWRSRRLACRIGPDQLRSRIEERSDRLMGEPFAAEVESLLGWGFPTELLASAAIGYAEVVDWMVGRCSRQEAVDRLVARTWRYARAQMTWLRSESGIIWIDAEAPLHEMVSAGVSAAGLAPGRRLA
jgi:tRNA dimethylallyltransferase